MIQAGGREVRILTARGVATVKLPFTCKYSLEIATGAYLQYGLFAKRPQILQSILMPMVIY